MSPDSTLHPWFVRPQNVIYFFFTNVFGLQAGSHCFYVLLVTNEECIAEFFHETTIPWVFRSGVKSAKNVIQIIQDTLDVPCTQMAIGIPVPTVKRLKVVF